ncbi:diaminopimelate epimerase [Streptoalloteichus tenebrarius]|uniref:Diaminopimelate epimerase n=1 Tax=Streptoalloteichus tenebrarius (strain ATCC 17920 / DSM 40477 / JCM 4838 / CBS 697.72 / NBRC 16177 / NCIMB 11028 / NRRL B-12390 / A12253. 1 / ISP 5477) TaxID=1933 RepID=A0ABT1I1Q5_STRSD|nr:diaminopimelate epimerase [Streptoalloteichus tenebrarius]MCP2261671.1 diaminopimelate epimerase [Streptoalloteichus tenebrarius]BFE99142.1 diaminopimelate epimerase [Streptoalloteichus tenebrarius]
MSDQHNRVLDGELAALRRRVVEGVPLDTLWFAVMHGNGNVIMIVDEERSGLPPAAVTSTLARELCRSLTTPKIDGVAFVRPSVSPLRMTYFECDGTHAQMCGNALRCVTRYGVERGYLSTEDHVETDDGVKWVSMVDGEPRVALGPGREYQQVRPDWYFAFSGLPHLVIVVDDPFDFHSIDVRREGAKLAHDERLCRLLNHPEGLHVDYVYRAEDHVALRTFEVGVEDETQACGTGVAATGYVAHRAWGVPFPVRVRTHGGVMTAENGEHGLVISGITGYLFVDEKTPVATTSSRSVL